MSAAMTERISRHEFGILDTSVVIDYTKLDSRMLPGHRAITAVTLAELYAGPNAAQGDAVEQAKRQQRLVWAQQIFRNPLPFDQSSAQTFGSVHLLVQESGRKPRKYTADLMIASIAIRNNLPLYTRNPKDFEPVTPLLEVIAI
jgi:predicted nucleic acid-binding protein